MLTELTANVFLQYNSTLSPVKTMTYHILIHLEQDVLIPILTYLNLNILMY